MTGDGVQPRGSGSLQAVAWVLALVSVAAGISDALVARAQREPLERMRWIYTVTLGGGSPSQLRLTDRETELTLPADFPWECHVSTISEDERTEERTLACRRDAAEVRVRAICARNWHTDTQGETLELNGEYAAGRQDRLLVSLHCLNGGHAGSTSVR